MDKKYQVFVSSTFDDLREERQEVIQALLGCGCIPVGMELFPAADDDTWQFIKEAIDECDYFLVIVAGRYGTCDGQGVSYTQKEYEYALEKQKPTIGFTHSDPGKIPSGQVDSDPGQRKKLEDFRRMVREKKLCQGWASPKELGLVVTQSIVNLKKRRPAVGWVRADQVASSEATAELLQLRKENEALKAELDQLAQSPPPGAELLVGEGVREFDKRFARNP